jgi:hypothetical protein
MNKTEWVERATSKTNDRPTLKRINFEDGLIVATDGFRLHVTQDDNPPYPKWREKVSEVFERKNDGIYVMIDGEYLRDAIEGGHSIILHVTAFNEPVELNVVSYGDKKNYAMIMPKVVGPEANKAIDDFWRPIKENKEQN